MLNEETRFLIEEIVGLTSRSIYDARKEFREGTGYLPKSMILPLLPGLMIYGIPVIGITGEDIIFNNGEEINAQAG